MNCHFGANTPIAYMYMVHNSYPYLLLLSQFKGFFLNINSLLVKD